MGISKARIESVINSQNIGVSLKNVTEFSLNNCELNEPISHNVPINLRLGKQIESIFSAILTSSKNYTVLQEGLQIMDKKTTIGELDFIIKDEPSNSIFHLELVYKFYLYDPKVSLIEVEKWIGPNRKDSLNHKLEKLKTKQFPLLNKTQTQNTLDTLNLIVDEQKLCFMANLFVPISLYSTHFLEINNKSIVGYWLSLGDFIKLNQNNSKFYLPHKNEWGIVPDESVEWSSIIDIEVLIKSAHERKFSPLCWIKQLDNSYEQCFVVWW
jgi:hypothetical protein